ncbi:uncharacterized protein FFNC_15317 [Fusarium fujikuroi]|nr:uncharacterized protein FFE2_15956 [Fusarium fujikuroi]SCO54063.1 uncharacterized protein FFNC_15317 [Fusarium fujikuroi]
MPLTATVHASHQHTLSGGHRDRIRLSINGDWASNAQWKWNGTDNVLANSALSKQLEIATPPTSVDQMPLQAAQTEMSRLHSVFHEDWRTLLPPRSLLHDQYTNPEQNMIFV